MNTGAAAGAEPEFLTPDRLLDSSVREQEGSVVARLPWGGALALVLVLLFDGLVFGTRGPWTWIGQRLPYTASAALELGLVRDRQQQRAAELADDALPRVTFVGTSRTDAAFQPSLVPEEYRPPVHTFLQTHARVFPHELRSMLHEIVDQRPDLVITLLSEFELMTPLRFVPLATGGSFGALVELMVRMGPEFVFEYRQDFLRMASVCLLDSYRYRDVVGKAGLTRLRRFPSTRLQPAGYVAWPEIPTDGVPLPMSAEDEQAALKYLQDYYGEKDEAVLSQFQQLRSVRPGRHAEFNMGVMERCFELLRAQGIEVLVVEGVNNPRTYALYDYERCRAEYIAYMERMQERHGVHWLRREELGTFEEIDFRDLTHAGKLGARKYTVILMSTYARMLTPDWQPPLPDPSAPPLDGEPPDR